MSPTVPGWRIFRFLDKGGNADVFEAERGNEIYALKVLHRTHGDGYLRFRDEVETNKQIGDLPGVLPMVDSHLPDRPSKKDPAWISMPIATPIAEVLEKVPLDEVVSAVREIAQALAVLHTRGVYHRDVKPGNCYYWEGRFVIGDFGLAEFPDKQDLTRSDKKLGPANYHAPEMLTDPRNAAPQPADVWCLAKTLWTLATRLKWPPPGHQRADDPSATLDSFVEHDRLIPLNKLIDRATRLAPSSRPTMQEFADELEAWLRPIPDSTGPLDFSDLSQRFAPVLDEVERDQQRREALEKEARRLAGLVNPQVDQIAEALKQYLPLPISRGMNMSPFQEVNQSAPIKLARIADHSDVMVNLNNWQFIAAILASISDDEQGIFSAMCLVTRAGTILHRWVEHRTFPLGSASESHLANELGALLKARIREGVEFLLKNS